MGKFGQLLDEARLLRHAAFAQSTRSTYRSQIIAYLRYCLYFERTPVPADQLTLDGYLAFLARSLNPSSIAGYFNGVRLLHVSVGLPNPLEENWEMSMLKRAFSRLKGVPPVQKLPISVDILAKIRTLLDFCSPADLVFWAALLIGFYGFLRKSTLLLKHSSTPPHLGITRGDILDISTLSFVVRVRHSKTIQFGQRVLHLPFAACAAPELCPVRALLFHLFASRLPPSASAFSYTSPAGLLVLSQPLFVSRLQRCLAAIGLDSKKFSAHSLRRGGTSFAINSGVSPLIVKARGDWSSNAFERYVFLEAHSTMEAAQQISANVAKSVG